MTLLDAVGHGAFGARARRVPEGVVLICSGVADAGGLTPMVIEGLHAAGAKQQSTRPFCKVAGRLADSVVQPEITLRVMSLIS